MAKRNGTKRNENDCLQNMRIKEKATRTGKKKAKNETSRTKRNEEQCRTEKEGKKERGERELLHIQTVNWYNWWNGMAYFIGECSNLTKKKLFAALLYSPINAFFFSVSTWAADEEQNSLVKCTFHLPVHWQIHCFASRFVHCNLQTETGKVRNLFDSDSMFALRTHTATSCKSCACVIHGSFF